MSIKRVSLSIVLVVVSLLVVVLEATPHQSGLEGRLPQGALVAALTVIGTGTIIAANKPPSVVSASLNTLRDQTQSQNPNIRLILRTVISDPNSLVDIDSVVVYVYRAGGRKDGFIAERSYAFKWIRKGSNNPPANCNTSGGRWYELIARETWTDSHTYLDRSNTSHDEVSPKLRQGDWRFALRLPRPARPASAVLCWNFEVRIADRSNATASSGGYACDTEFTSIFCAPMSQNSWLGKVQMRSVDARARNDYSDRVPT